MLDDRNLLRSINHRPRAVALAHALAVSAALMLAVAPLAGCGGPSRPDAATPATPSTSAAGVEVRTATVDLPANPTVAAARFVVENGSPSADALVGASSPDADSVAVHRSGTDAEGRATMVEVSRVPVPARSRVTFEPGGLHVMLTGLHRELELGDTVTLVLRFEHAGRVTVTAEVVEPAVAGEHAHA